ncbi:MAG: SPFH domain-containing protein [Alphaproteobacteria bacterium]|nr:SPFH domain-containing protein [Alphaproteobacteria bacterium]
MFGYRYLKSKPTDHVILYSGGRVRRQGMGLSGFVFAPFATAAAVPTDARDEIFAVEAMTADYQTITIQGLISFRIKDASVAAQRQDFSINLISGAHTGEPMKQIVERLRAIAQTACRDALVRSTLDAALNKSDELSQVIMRGIAEDKRLAGDGIGVDRVLVLALKPTPEIRKALEANLREQLLRQADAAMFERRRAATADEHDLKLRDEKNKRELAENALANEQALEAERRKVAEARAETQKAEAAADAEAQRLRLAPWSELKPEQIAALAFKDWANRETTLTSLSLGGDALERIANRIAKTGE